MKTKTIITELSQEDLVNLLSFATFGSYRWTVCIAQGTRQLLDIGDLDSREDVWAKALLAGYPIYITDHDAEGVTYGDRGTVDHEDDDESAIYTTRLEDITAGLQSAMDGDFAPNDEDEVELAARCAMHLRDESCAFDAVQADILLQIILFGTIVYGYVYG